MLLSCANGGYSWLVGVHGKARLEGNGRRPWREAERSPWAPTNQLFGRSYGVPQLRYNTCQGRRPLPARCALLCNTIRALYLSLAQERSTYV